jgi:hypothetical protein
LWIVPDGATRPRSEPEAFVATEFGRVTRADAITAIKKFSDELDSLPDHQGYIIIYGKEAQMTLQEKWFLSEYYYGKSSHDRGRVTIIRAGKRKSGIGTMMWIVPPERLNPTP